MFFTARFVLHRVFCPEFTSLTSQICRNCKAFKLSDEQKWPFVGWYRLSKNICGQPPWIKAHVGLPRARHATVVMMVNSRVCITYLNPQGSLYPWFMAPLSGRHVKLLNPSVVLKNQRKTWIFRQQEVWSCLFSSPHLVARCQAQQVVPGQQRTSEGDLCHVLGWSFDKACKTGHPLFLSGRVGSKFLFKNLGLFHQVSLGLE